MRTVVCAASRVPRTLRALTSARADVCLFYPLCSESTEFLVAASCLPNGKKALGAINAATSLLPLLQSWRELGVEPALNLLLAMLNVSTLVDRQPALCKTLLPCLVSLLDEEVPVELQVRCRCRSSCMRLRCPSLASLMVVSRALLTVLAQSVTNLILANLWKHPVRDGGRTLCLCFG